MSASTSHESDEKRVPISIVFLVTGFIILGAVLSIWLVSPSLMPLPVYRAVSNLLEETAVTPPTPASIAVIPTIASPTVLLPETPAQTGEVLPDYFVSVENAAKRDPFIGEPIRILIPQIDLDAPVTEIGLEQISKDDQTYYQWPVPNGFEAGWHNNSARLGKSGNTVLNGHHNIYGEVFRDLVDLTEGDEIILFDTQQKFIYEVTETYILAERDQPMSVRIANAKWIAPTNDERITLITCWPYTDNSHRLIIVAKPVSVGKGT